MSGRRGSYERSNFARWLEAQLAQRGWGLSDLARASGIPLSTISNWVNVGTRPRAWQWLRALADVFGVPYEEVERQAGLRPFEGSVQAEDMLEDPRVKEMAHLLAAVPERQRASLLDAMLLVVRAALEHEGRGEQSAGAHDLRPLGLAPARVSR